MSNGVLKGMNPRFQGNIPAKEQFSLSETKPTKAEEKEIVDPATSEKITKATDNTKAATKKFVNQKAQIKISDNIKTELDALKAITKTKFDYEVIELLIDTYVQNSLTATQKRKFKALTSDDF